MTVNTTTAKAQYNGNGVTTAFTVPFRFLDNTHLQVIRTSSAGVDTPLVISTDYTVTGAGAATGTVTMLTAPASGEKLTIVRNMPFSQQIDLVNGDPLPAETLEAGLDARAMEAQQLKEAVARSLSLPLSSTASAELPEAIPLALLGWNSAGNALQSFAGAAGTPVSSFMAPAVAAVNATAAQTAIGGTTVGRAVFSAADSAAARTAIGAAASGANADITSLTALTAGGLPDNSVLTNDIANAAVTPAKLSQPATLGTAVATTSGTSIDFTGIPSWVNEIDVIMNAVSTSGAGSAALLVQLGSGSVQTTGYLSYAGFINNSNQTGSLSSTAGMLVTGAAGAASTHSGVLSLKRISGNTWVAAGSGGGLDGAGTGNIARNSGGTVTLGGALDRVRFTTTNGTDAFDAGSVNILYK